MELGSEDTTENKSVTASTLTEPTFQRASIKRVKQGEKIIAHLERCMEGKNMGISAILELTHNSLREMTVKKLKVL